MVSGCRVEIAVVVSVAAVVDVIVAAVVAVGVVEI